MGVIVFSLEDSSCKFESIATFKAACTFIITNGFEYTTLRKIEDNCGIQRGLLYFKFKTKEGLLGAIADCAIGILINGIIDIGNNEGDPINKLRDAVRFNANASKSYGEIFHVVRMEHFRLSADFRKSMADSRTKCNFTGIG